MHCCCQLWSGEGVLQLYRLVDSVFQNTLQGSFMKRHKIPKEDGSPMQPADIRVADNVRVYGRVFRIVDADAFTRAYFAAQGITLAPAEAVPLDPFHQLQAAKAQEQSKGEGPLPKPRRQRCSSIESKSSI